jgi:hypothetical protein
LFFPVHGKQFQPCVGVVAVLLQVKVQVRL